VGGFTFSGFDLNPDFRLTIRFKSRFFISADIPEIPEQHFSRKTHTHKSFVSTGIPKYFHALALFEALNYFFGA